MVTLLLWCLRVDVVVLYVVSADAGVKCIKGAMSESGNMKKKCVADEKLSGIKLLVLLFPVVD